MLFLVASPLKADDEDVLNRVIKLPKGKGTVYKMLGQVTDHTGYLFIYDSNLIDNDKEIKLKEGSYTIAEAIFTITGNPNLGLRVVGNHILLYKPEISVSTLPRSPSPPPTEDNFITIEGSILNRYTDDPIAFATVGISKSGIGTVTNLNGEFRFRLPDSLQNEVLQFSHLGFIPQEIESSFLAGGHHIITLEPKVIPIQEVVVRLINPQKLLEEMLEKREQNYAGKPVYHTTFYREGVEYKKGFASLSEAVFKIYKTPYSHPEQKDQVKLLKMRRIEKEQERDTIVAKFKSGINACLMLDLVKHLPDFVTDQRLYDYAHSDIRTIDDRLANVISFEPKKGIQEPLFKGELYIDSENSALLGATFEINPQYIDKSADIYVEKKSRGLSIIPQQVTYTLSYKSWNDTYYINHIRGDLHFKIKKKRQLFSKNLHTWFEMVTSKTETEDVSRFARNESLQPHTIFSDTHFSYDKNFWENFNIIPPEEKLSEAIGKINTKIEETGF